MTGFTVGKYALGWTGLQADDQIILTEIELFQREWLQREKVLMPATASRNALQKRRRELAGTQRVRQTLGLGH
jgi:hypothetical protein